MTVAKFRLGAEALAGNFVRSPPTAAITAPGSTIATSSVTITWTYTSVIARAEAFYRVRLRSPDDSVLYYDSGILPGAILTIVPAYALSDGTIYEVVVQVSDGFDWSAEATSTFLVQLADVADYPNAIVGSVYEVGINGQGYMLSDKAEGDMQYRRQTTTLTRPTRYAQGNTPFSEAIERYTFVGWADWRDGAGQRQRHRDDSSPAAFYDSEGVNPFESTGLQLLPATVQTLANSYANPLSVIYSDKLLSLTGTNTVTSVASIGGATTPFTVAGQGTSVAMASDGVNWYLADGANIHRGATAVDPGAAWSTVDAKVIAWAADRICVAYASSGTTPNRFSTLTTAGVEEVASGRITLPVDSTITSIVGGDGYVWFSARRNQQGLVYAWKAGSTDAPFVAFEFPAGQFPQSLGFYLGNVFIRCVEPLSAGGTKASIYRAATSSGRLVPTLVTQIESATDDHTVGSWGGDDRFGMFSWKKVAASGASGVGCIDLSTGGWARWLYAPSAAANGDVVSVLNWNGRTVFAVASYGVCHEGTAPLATGNLKTDLADLGTNVSKVYSQLKADLAPLPTGGGLLVEYSMDGGVSYNPTSYSLTGAGLQTLVGEIAKQNVSLCLKFTLTASATSPVLRSLTVRAHPIGLADQVLVLPINCSDVIEGLNGQELPESGPGTGAARARLLESMAETRVRVQDIDWVLSQSATVWEVDSVDVRSVGVFSPHQNRQVHSQIAVVLLRRSLK